MFLAPCSLNLSSRKSTQEALAQRLRKRQSTVANKLRLLRLPDEVQQAILKRQISERHARALIAIIKWSSIQLLRYPHRWVKVP